MEIVLRETIDKLGHAGDVVSVRNGYARNYLLPRKLAYAATPGNLRVIEQERNSLLRHEAKQREEAEQLRETMLGVETLFKRRVGEHGALYGSVTSNDIAEDLEKQGFKVDKRKIGLDEHIKQLGEFTVGIRLFPEVVAEVKVRVEPEEVEAVEAVEQTATSAEPTPETETE